MSWYLRCVNCLKLWGYPTALCRDCDRLVRRDPRLALDKADRRKLHMEAPPSAPRAGAASPAPTVRTA